LGRQISINKNKLFKRHIIKIVSNKKLFTIILKLRNYMKKCFLWQEQSLTENQVQG